MGSVRTLTLPGGPGYIWEALLTVLQGKEKGWELNLWSHFPEAFQGTRLLALMMENLCTCFPPQLQITCLNKADLITSHFCLHQKGRHSEASLRPLHTEAQRLAGSLLPSVTEILWGDADGWNVAMDGYSIFRRDRQRRAGEGHALR